MIAKSLPESDPWRLYQFGVALAEPEERRYAVADKVLRAALAQFPPASNQKKYTALALADLWTNVDGKPKECGSISSPRSMRSCRKST